MKNIYLSLTSLAFMLFLIVICPSCSKKRKEPAQPKIAEITQAYFQDFNAHDTEKILSYFTEDIRYEVVGGFSLQQKGQVRSLLDWYAALNEKLSYDEIGVRGDTVSFKLSENNDWLRLLGAKESIFKYAYIVFRGDSVSSFKGEISAESLKGLRAPYSSFLSWAKKERKDQVDKLMPGGQFSIGTAEALEWRNLLSEWWQLGLSKAKE